MLRTPEDKNKTMVCNNRGNLLKFTVALMYSKVLSNASHPLFVFLVSFFSIITLNMNIFRVYINEIFECFKDGKDIGCDLLFD